MEKTLLLDLLKELYPAECEEVGQTNLQDIVDETKFESPEHGSSMDLSASISTLILAVSFIKSVMDIYVLLKKDIKRNPHTEEIEIKMSIPKELIQHLDRKTRKKIISQVINKLKVE